jgi:predicted RNase H-like HicB family nuclease
VIEKTPLLLLDDQPYHERVYRLAMEYYREEDGRWIADIPALPGVTAYGRTKKQATASVQALALRLIADRLEHGEAVPGPITVSFLAA